MAEKLWGGRFSKKTNKLVDQFTKSIHYDQKLAKYDVLGSLAHIDILKKAKILNVKEHAQLKKGLSSILQSVEKGAFFKAIDSSFEDIHSYIQKLLEKKVGKVALKLHSCRSRNDQVVFDVKCYCLSELHATAEWVKKLNVSITKLAAKNKKIILPGYTHMQHAIPVALHAHLLSYAEILTNDIKRLQNAASHIKLSLGSGALAGTFIPSACYANKGINAPTNSIAAVSDRDFIIESINALCIIAMHLSRLAEDFILWSTKEFDFIDIDDAFCTGSSLMPQKKNPDALELIRGYTGKLYGNLMSVLVMMKGLPLSYNRDMQLDKEPLFESFEIVQSELQVLCELLKNVKFKKENIAKQLDDESLYATDLADYLVQKKVSFKEAHGIIGKLIKHKYKGKKEIFLHEMNDTELQKFHPLLTAKVIKKIIDPEYSVKSKKSVRKRKI